MKQAALALLALAATAAASSASPPLAGHPALDRTRAPAPAMKTPLTARLGDPAAGRRIVVDRTVGTCLLCHTGPFPEPHLHGSIGPSLADVGSRLSAGQIRLRLVEPARAEPASVMPSFRATGGLRRVGQPWRGRPILTDQQIEDVVAFLTTLRTP